jgi:hypothetical protein
VYRAPVSIAPRTVARFGVLMAVLVLPLAVASCSGSTPASTGPTTTVKTVDRTACALITPSEVRSTMGVTVGQPAPVVQGSVTTCTYKATTLSRSVLIEYDISASLSSLTTDQSTVEKRGIATTPLTGLGDGAYSFGEGSGKSTVNGVATLEGTLQTIVTGTSSPAQVRALSALILSKIAAGSKTTTTTTTAG